MAITRKPKAAQAADEATVQQLISKGGSVATPTGPDNEPKLLPVLLRIPSDMVAQIDAAVKRRRPVRISRIAWIIEALNERLIAEERDIK
jgi:hypothetical protein